MSIRRTFTQAMRPFTWAARICSQATAWLEQEFPGTNQLPFVREFRGNEVGLQRPPFTYPNFGFMLDLPVPPPAVEWVERDRFNGPVQRGDQVRLMPDGLYQVIASAA